MLPSDTVTFLFSDIEGSTRLMVELGDRYPEVSADHRALIRNSVQANGGVEVGTEGDSGAYQEGKDMDLDQAVAYALREYGSV